MSSGLNQGDRSALDRDVFMRTLIRELAGVLQDIVGLDEAEGFIALVGLAMARHIEKIYLNDFGVERIDGGQLANLLVDLKERIDGDFYVISQEAERIVLGNRRCPFGDKVVDRPSLCMMTSNVFGHIAAQSRGQARVALEQTIAQGDPTCLVTISFATDGRGVAGPGRDYFRREHG